MGYTLEKFLFCLELQLGGIICGWWGMIASGIGVFGVLAGLLFGRQYFHNLLPVSFGTGGTLASGIVAIIILIIYFYFSYQLLLGSQSGSASQMFGYLVIHGIFVVLFILGMFNNVSSLLPALIYAYLWYCIYSLYVRTGGSGIV